MAARPKPPLSPAGVAVLTVSAYETVAEAVNGVLDEHLLPTLLGGLHGFGYRKALKRLTPMWLRLTIVVAIAGVIDAIVKWPRGQAAASPPPTPQP